jgi:lipoprotein-anchoring transpeptidase ErfK/SrfK
MTTPDRLLFGAVLCVATGLAGCVGSETPQIAVGAPPAQTAAGVSTKPVAVAALDPKFSALYQPVSDKFPVKGLQPSIIRKGFERKEIAYATKEPPGTIVVDPHAHYLYYVLPNGRAMRYGVAVGKAGFAWSGTAYVKTKQEWPDWYPPKEMIERHPELKPQLDKLQSGMGVAGGERNPLGARAMYLWQGNKDTYFRIHGTLEPHSIGTNASSGCIRLINQDAIDLYTRVQEGTKVVVL